MKLNESLLLLVAIMSNMREGGRGDGEREDNFYIPSHLCRC